jgi:nitrate reductase NapE component
VAIVTALFGAVIIISVLWDGFETMVLPRRVTRRFRFARFFYRFTWSIWLKSVCLIFPERRRENYRSYFAPLSLLLLLSIWAVGLVTGFGLLYWAFDNAMRTQGEAAGFGTALYMSGSTFFTLGYGDVTPIGGFARTLAVIESGTGFGFLAVLIGHLPGLAQSFAKRETRISLLDSRAGSPPTAFEIMRRQSRGGLESIREFLKDWEGWSAELLESHLSYPVLAYYRSQHENQSWIAALTAILDASAFMMAGLEDGCYHQAELTFAMARHALVDLALIFKTSPRPFEQDRLSREDLLSLREVLVESGLHLFEAGEIERRLEPLRQMYEPCLRSLSEYLYLAVPPWVPPAGRKDNWETSAWDDAKNSGLEKFRRMERHF